MTSIKQLFPGMAVALIVALAAKFLGEHYGAPTMLYALLLGLSMNFIYDSEQCKSGIDFTGKRILRFGVALLGLRIALGDITAFGWKPLALILVGVISTILIGMLIAKLFGLEKRFGMLTGGAVAICGASAAMAISAVMPREKGLERDTIFAVVGVTTLSTVAMIIYPVISNWMGMDDRAAGIFLGATIHDVAQVVGAGYSISEEAGDLATVTKLMRVTFLVPVVMVIALSFRMSGNASDGKTPTLPVFLIAFIVLVGINSVGIIPQGIKEFLIELSRFSLIAAIAAIGIKSRLKDLLGVGLAPVALMTLETAWLAVLVLIALPLVQ